MNKISDFVEFYPTQDDPELQRKISDKREFQELSSGITEEILSEGEQAEEAYYLYKHQRLFSRISRFLHRALIIDKPGVGKTCKVLGAMQWYKENDSMVNKFIVLVPNDAILLDVKNQIICKCTGGKYYVDRIKEAKNSKSRENIITRYLKKHFIIMTREKFIRRIMEKYPDYQLLVEQNRKRAQKMEDQMMRERAKYNEEKLRKHFSGSFIYLDEAHLMSDKIEEFDESVIPESDEEEKSYKKQNKDQISRDKKEYYRQYYRLFHLIERSIIVLTTATPFINETKDILPLINLLRPIEEKMSEDIKLEQQNLDYISKYFGNYIHYIRPRDNKVDILREGKLIEWKGQKITSFESQMKDEQKKIFFQALQKDGEGKKLKKDNSLQASSFTFPNGLWGNEGVRKYYRPVPIAGKDKVSIRDEFGFIHPNSEFISNFKGRNEKETIEKIEKYSAKCASILRKIKESKNVVYITVANIESEALVYAWCLQLLGYTLYTRKESAFESVNKKVGDYCVSANPFENKISSHFEEERSKMQKPYFALYTGELMKKDIIRSSKELVSSPHNYNGYYIKVFIGSPKVKLGININNVDQIHNTRSDWNEGGNLQRESRAIRDTSHTYIIELMKKELEEKGEPSEDVRFPIKLFRHAAVTQDENRNKISKDLDVYSRAIRKEMPIQKVMRMLMITAIDCNLNKKRNTLPESYDYSFDCNYQVCNYDCYQTMSDDVDDTTYNIYYLRYRLKNLLKTIYPTLRDRGFIRYEQIFEIHPDIAEFHIVAAISELILNRISVRDKYGNYCYLSEYQNVVYLVDDYSSYRGIDRIYYSFNMINVETKQNKEIIDEIFREKYLDYSKEARDIFVKTPEFLSDYVQNLDIRLQVHFLENSILNYYFKRNDEFDDEITKIYRGYWFEVREPVTMIESSINFDNEIDARGRKAIKILDQYEIDRRKENYIQYYIDENTELVCFHILYITDYKLGNKLHGATERYLNAQGRYRLIKPSEGFVWRDLNRHEYEAYRRIIQEKRKSRTVDAKKEYVIYGSIDNQGRLKITDARKEILKKEQRGSAKAKSFVCTQHQPVQSLFYFLWYHNVDIISEFPTYIQTLNSKGNGYLLNNFDAAEEHFSIPKNVADLELYDENGNEIADSSQLSDEEKIYYYNMYIITVPTTGGGGGLKKKELCETIQKYIHMI